MDGALGPHDGQRYYCSTLLRRFRGSGIFSIVPKEKGVILEEMSLAK